MADGPLLGCPHCGKPIAFAQELAGRLAACPHCRGPFQMPTSPPVPSAPAAQPSAQQPPKPVARKPDVNLQFNPEESPRYQPGERLGTEPFCYPNAEVYSLSACISGIAFSILLAAFLVTDVIVPMFKLPGVLEFIKAFIGSLAVLALMVTGIAVSLLVRNVVLVIVDAARQKRAP